MAQGRTHQISLEDLHRASLGLHSLRSTAAITERLREEAEQLTLASSSFVYLVDQRWGELYGVRSAAEGEVRFGRDQGIAGWVVTNGEVWNCGAVADDPLYLEQVDAPPGGEPGTILAAPVSTGGEPVGVLMLFDKDGGAFDDEDELFTALLCEHAAAALLSARALEASARFSKSLAAAVAAAVDAKSVATVDHAARVAQLAVELGKAMGLPEKELDQLEYAAYLHDVGRIDLASLPGAKPGEPGSLERLRNHVFFTDAVLRRIDFPEDLGEVHAIAMAHHESIDGSGFPMGRTEEDLPLAARILQVANAFDVICFQRRSLIKGDPVQVALAHLRKNRGKLFDEKVVDAFVSKKIYEIERRRFPRYDYETSVDVTILKADGVESETFQTEAVDISEGGILFRFDRDLAPAELVRLLIHLPTEKIEALAKVARAIPDGDRWKIGAYFVWHGTVG